MSHQGDSSLLKISNCLGDPGDVELFQYILLFVIMTVMMLGPD